MKSKRSNNKDDNDSMKSKKSNNKDDKMATIATNDRRKRNPTEDTNPRKSMNIVSMPRLSAKDRHDIV